ncbi:histidine kinase N-terminal domain-containing protein [Thermaerobacillus caldiproteolyticus]|uniref:histidine kinase n=1 Tax=Thermaerobacillus caldiproteolyticus TaxID=247480 RepID=A0A7W0BZ04_9BACL|nr:histidine kinase N-terminal domain-containing protein [Anoxybacillus caldiproteolyticus]MBA2875513.1 signal transduction histidine kinase [Anoxybacillus caldiproteolyticus]
MKSSVKKLIEFLEQNLSHFLQHWKNHMYIANHDKYIGYVEHNGLAVFQLVKTAMGRRLCIDEIQQLAYKIAKERAEANINIGDFVYNTNLGRSLVIKYSLQSGLPIEELQPLIDDINYLFDHFSFYAVTKYTELKEAELQEKNLLITQSHKDRLTLLGQMSSSFVHEFRNPLTSIMGFIQLLKFEHPDLKYLDIIEHELEQLKFRISQFLHASRKDILESEKETFFLYELFEEIIEFLYPSFVDGDAEVSTAIDKNIRVFAYKDQLRQVFINILLNSIEAVKEKPKPRRIHICASVSGNFTHIHISNNGPAIPPEIVKTIFEPFFTTKKLGTGIGLYVCKKIIEKHGGHITCTSNEQATSFSISLPLEKKRIV